MKQDQYHLRAVLEHFDIRNKYVAAALNVHPSMITRWLNNERLIGINSKYLEPLADYILSRSLSPADTAWLEKKLREYGIAGSLTSVAELKNALKIWLVTDPNDDLSGMKNQVGGVYQARVDDGQYRSKAGIVEIEFLLSTSFAKQEPGTIIQIHLFDESLLLSDSFVHAILNTAHAFDLRFQVLLAASGQSKTLSRAVAAFMPLIMEGSIKVGIVYKDAVLSIDQTVVIIPEYAAIIFAVLPDSKAIPVSLLIHEKTFIRDLGQRFAEAFSRSQPLLASPEWSTGRQVRNLSRQCYETAGALAIMRDGLNPLVLREEAFSSYLRICGYEGEAYAWRIDEFRSRKAAFDDSLKRGMTLRELVPLSLLEDVVDDGVCTMFGEDFLEPDQVTVGSDTCIELLEGYSRYLNIYPDFSLRFTGSFPETFEESLCMIKENRQVLVIRRKQGDAESYAVSQQMAFLQSVSQIFEQLWEGLDYVTHRGETTLQTLKRYVLRIMARERQI